MILGAGFRGGWWLASALALVLLLMAFAGMLRALHHMAYEPGPPAARREAPSWAGAAPSRWGSGYCCSLAWRGRRGSPPRSPAPPRCWAAR
jgi:hypothetical protein